MPQLESTDIRIQACASDERYRLEFACANSDGTWTTILATGLRAAPSIFSLDQQVICEDPIIEWREPADDPVLRRAEAFLTTAEVSEDARTLVLRGSAGCHNLKERLEIRGGNSVHITITDRLDAVPGTIAIGRLLSQFFFVPEGKANRAYEPLDFAWLPNLHRSREHVCGDHFFRSPAVIVQSDGYFAALVPDLELFARHRRIGHALDLRTTDTTIEAPRLSYGICPTTYEEHVYTAHRAEHTEVVEQSAIAYGFYLFFGRTASATEVTQLITAHLWSTYGHPTLQDVRPQVLPFAEYGRRYPYRYELPSSVREVTIDGAACAGIDNVHRRGANLHAWENDLHVAFGIRHYADQWDDHALRRIANGILQLSLKAPSNHGAFPCIYNFRAREYEGTLFWTARAADARRGYDTAAMGVTTWWQLAWYAKIDSSPEILARAVSYGRFLESVQLPSGAVPTYFLADLSPSKQLLESATTAISGAVLARLALITGDQELQRAALLAGRFIAERIVPGLAFNDFETYYSCSPKPLHAIDYWTGIRPHNNLSLQWAADQFLALYQLTDDASWLQGGEYLMSILSLYQQVWNPSHLPGYLFGGFGVMNTDSEWNDGRQARFVSTYADYYDATGAISYIERAVAACRASFALMDMPENHDNAINDVIMDEGPGLGYAPENTHHRGIRPPRTGGIWTGLDWSSGGALAASADLERRYGGALVDGMARTCVPIDGVNATVDSWEDSSISLSLGNALAYLPRPYAEPRQILLRFARMSALEYAVRINGQAPNQLTRAALEQGIMVQLD